MRPHPEHSIFSNFPTCRLFVNGSNDTGSLRGHFAHVPTSSLVDWSVATTSNFEMSREFPHNRHLMGRSLHTVLNCLRNETG